MTNIRLFLANLINLGLGTIAFFIIGRIVLRLFSANPATPFVAFMYDISGFFIAPFRGIFSNPTIDGTVLDIPAIVALIIYAFIAYLLSALLSALITRHHAHTTTDIHEN